jgi:hypothetical protein
MSKIHGGSGKPQGTLNHGTRAQPRLDQPSATSGRKKAPPRGDFGISAL